MVNAPQAATSIKNAKRTTANTQSAPRPLSACAPAIRAARWVRFARLTAGASDPDPRRPIRTAAAPCWLSATICQPRRAPSCRVADRRGRAQDRAPAAVDAILPQPDASSRWVARGIPKRATASGIHHPSRARRPSRPAAAALLVALGRPRLAEGGRAAPASTSVSRVVGKSRAARSASSAFPGRILRPRPPCLRSAGCAVAVTWTEAAPFRRAGSSHRSIRQSSPCRSRSFSPGRKSPLRLP